LIELATAFFRTLGEGLSLIPNFDERKKKQYEKEFNTLLDLEKERTLAMERYTQDRSQAYQLQLASDLSKQIDQQKTKLANLYELYIKDQK